jgi:hypothetical protein
VFVCLLSVCCLSAESFFYYYYYSYIVWRRARKPILPVSGYSY